MTLLTAAEVAATLRCSKAAVYALARSRSIGQEREPKTPEARRQIALPPVTVEALRRWRVAQARPVGRIFPVAEASVARIVARACAAAGVEPFPPHSARRFVATVLAADPKAASMVLGHTSSKLTLDTYAKGGDSERARAAARIEEAMK